MVDHDHESNNDAWLTLVTEVATMHVKFGKLLNMVIEVAIDDNGYGSSKGCMADCI